MDNSLLISKYFQYILEHSNEILDILYPEDAPHEQPQPVEQEEQEQEQEEVVQTREVGDDPEPEPEPEPTPEPEPLNPKDNKIFPLLQPANLSFPFIVHARTGITVNYTKDIEYGPCGWYNIVNYTISCVSDDYVQCIELANAVRHAVETYRWHDEDIYIHPIQLLTVAEYTTDNDAFVQELQFQCMVE